MFRKMKRAAFQILLAKARALNMRSSVRTMSVPGAAPSSSDMRTASVPYFSVTSSGSMTLPRVLDIFWPLGVAHQGVDVDLAEGDVAGGFQAHHDHAGDPEEQDVEAGDHQRGGVVGAQVLGLVGPAEGGEGPEAGAEPGVEHVGVLLEAGGAAGAGFGRLAGHQDLAAILAVPGRDAVAPPELARDAPVADVVHPLVIGLGAVLGSELDAAVLDGADGRLGQRLGLDEPLGGDERLDGGLAALALAQAHLVRLDLLEQAEGVEVGDHALAGLEAVQAGVGAGGGGHVRGVVDDLDLGQVVAAAGLEVVEVVGGGDLDDAGAELRVRHFVEDDGDLAVHERQLDGLAVEIAVALVLGIDGARRCRRAWSRAAWWRPPGSATAPLTG